MSPHLSWQSCRSRWKNLGFVVPIFLAVCTLINLASLAEHYFARDDACLSEPDDDDDEDDERKEDIMIGSVG